ncbi:MAG: DUF4900 domain-containing protein, partial [Candidatus Zixiibacteriota bacterium]
MITSAARYVALLNALRYRTCRWRVVPPLRAPFDQQGTSLLLAIGLGLFLSVLGYVTVATVITDARSSTLYLQSTQAFWLAETGVELAQRWLRYQDPPPGGTSSFTQFDHISAGAGSYTVTVDPDDNNTNTYLKKYVLRSVGMVGGVERTIEVEVVATTFNYYAYLTGDEGGTIWFNGGDVLEGPVHSNDQISITQNPVFMGKVTSSATSFNQGQPYNPDFQQGYQLGVPPVLFPTAEDVTNNYWSVNSTPPTLVIDATGSKHAAVEFRADGTVVYSVWHRDARGRRVYDIEDATASVANLNGLIWVDGDVRVKGTLNGTVTLVST